MRYGRYSLNAQDHFQTAMPIHVRQKYNKALNSAKVEDYEIKFYWI